MIDRVFLNRPRVAVLFESNHIVLDHFKAFCHEDNGGDEYSDDYSGYNDCGTAGHF